MIRQLLEEVKSAPLDEASRNRLKEIHQASIKELEAGLAPELVEELERLALPFTEDQTPSEGELRIAQAQLVGWLEGLFHGIQTAIYAQQMAARAQFEQMRRALPMGRAGGRPGSRSSGTASRRRSRATPAGCTSWAAGPRCRPTPDHDQAQQTHQHQRRPGCGGPGSVSRLAGVDRREDRALRGRLVGGAPSPSSRTTWDTTVSLLMRVPLVPPATQGWPVPVTKNMYSVTGDQRAEAAVGAVAVGLHLRRSRWRLALVDEVDVDGLGEDRPGQAVGCGPRWTSVTTPLKTAIALVVLSRDGDGCARRRLGRATASLGREPGTRTTQGRQQRAEQGRRQAAQHRIITTDHRSKMPAST